MKNLVYTFIYLFVLTEDVTAQNGRVGINTTSPSALFHVKDSSVVFTAQNAVPATPGNPPVSDGGTRMMWYPDKAAFRVGNVNSTQWNKVNIGTYSVAMGQNTKAIGSYSFAHGLESTASGSRAVALGSATTASGGSSFAMGGGTTASHAFTVAMGDITTASGYASVAMGTFCSATGSASVSMGGSNSASGHTSTSFGNANIASGESSIALGFLTKAIGFSSTTLGNQTKAKSYACVTLGQHNDTTSISSTTWELADPVFIIGNGASSASLSNAMTVLKNGNVGIGTVAPGFKLEVNGTVAKPGGGSWSAISDVRMKQAIKPYRDGLNTLQQINPVIFRYNHLSGFNTKKEYIGVIAQELKEVAPYMVSVSTDKRKGNEDDYLQVDNSAMIYMLINAVKEQQKMIETMMKEIEELRQDVMRE